MSKGTKRGGKLKWIIIAIVVLGVIGAVAGGGDDDKPSDSNPQKTGQAENANPETQGNPENQETEEQKSEFVVGDIVEASDLRITFVSAEEYTSDNEFIQPKEGNIFYKMEFEFENISDSDEYVSSYNFDCYADDYDMEQTWMDGFDLDATLSPGKKTKGAVFFEVPADSNAITLEYETNFWSENKVVFKVK